MPADGAILEWTTHPTRPEALLLMAGWTDAPRLYCYDGHSLQDTGLTPRSPVDFDEVHARARAGRDADPAHRHPPQGIPA
ncbi:hypothetical protein [Planobispora longispora]|uniref:Uncharacterized protein n=1 Tax=Planobispora longispora TaxID=28887 RepID=A0A8J3WAE6_9ACTN|nr:hypothetical protein [Planobispora longispora]GIH80761.1 hypothetical protein Plo01_71900 [Planobispora longispora]